MKKTVITPNSDLNKKIMSECSDSDTYAKRINALPNEKRSHGAFWIVSTLAACLAVAVGLGIYLKAPKTPWYNLLPVGDELFETYTPKNNGIITNVNRLYPEYDDVDSYFENADLVIIGYPENSFHKEPQSYYSRENGFVDITGDWYTLDTIRKIKVLDVLKGDLDTDYINLHVKEAATWDENGKFEIKDLDEYHFVQKQNVKYIFILHKTDVYNGEDVYYVGYDCCINVDGLHTESLDEVTPDFFKGVMDKYALYFEKYNRSAEAGVTEEKLLIYAEDAKYFKNENEAYEYSDLVIVGSPKNELRDDRRVASDGTAIATDKEAGEYRRDEVFTLRDINVLKVIKGDENISDIFIASSAHYHYDKYMKASFLWDGSNSSYEDPITKKDSVYLYYLKRDNTLGENVYRISGVGCIANLDGAPLISVRPKRLYDMYMRNMDYIKEYLPEKNPLKEGFFNLLQHFGLYVTLYI